MNFEIRPFSECQLSSIVFGTRVSSPIPLSDLIAVPGISLMTKSVRMNVLGISWSTLFSQKMPISPHKLTLCVEPRRALPYYLTVILDARQRFQPCSP